MNAKQRRHHLRQLPTPGTEVTVKAHTSSKNIKEFLGVVAPGVIWAKPAQVQIKFKDGNINTSMVVLVHNLKTI